MKMRWTIFFILLFSVFSQKTKTQPKNYEGMTPTFEVNVDGSTKPTGISPPNFSSSVVLITIYLKPKLYCTGTITSYNTIITAQACFIDTKGNPVSATDVVVAAHINSTTLLHWPGRTIKNRGPNLEEAPAYLILDPNTEGKNIGDYLPSIPWFIDGRCRFDKQYPIIGCKIFF